MQHVCTAWLRVAFVDSSSQCADLSFERFRDEKSCHVLKFGDNSCQRPGMRSVQLQPNWWIAVAYLSVVAILDGFGFVRHGSATSYC